MIPPPEIVATADGSQTLRHPGTGETYHSVNGAVAESRHVFIRNGLMAFGAHRVRILEVGFGSGLNALLTLRAAAGREVEYTAIEKFPVGGEVVSGMELAADPAFTALHEAQWDTPQRIAPGFILRKIGTDLADAVFDTIFDVVYFDAFAPRTQPEMWTEEVFGRIFAAMAPGGLLVTYSAKGDVKRALRSAGFVVERLPGAPGKRHMVRALKPAREGQQ